MFESPDQPQGRSWTGAGILVLFAFLIPLSWSALRKVSIDHDPARWISSSSPEVRSQQDLQRTFRSAEVLLLGCENATLVDPRLPLLKERLLGAMGEDGIRRGGSPYVAAATTAPERLGEIVRSGVPASEAHERLVGSLIGQGRLRVALTPEGREAPDRTIRQIVDACRTELGLEVRAFPRTIPFVPDDDDALFAGIAVEVPADAPVWTMAEDDLELAWDGMHSRHGAAPVQGLIEKLVGYPTIEQTGGVRLVASSEFVAGGATAMEVRLSEAGMLDPTSALSDIRRLAATCAISEKTLLLSGDTVTRVDRNRGFESLLSGLLSSPWIAVVAWGACATLILAWGLRSPLGAGLSLLLTGFVLVLTVAAAAVGGMDFSLPSLLALIPVLCVTIPLVIAVVQRPSALSTPGDRRGAIAAALAVGIAALPMLLAVAQPVRWMSALLGLSMLLIGLLAKSGLFASGSAPVVLDGEMSRLSRWIVGRGRWIGAAGLLMAVAGALGLSMARFDGRLVTPYLAGVEADRARILLNDTLTGTSQLDAVIRFQPEVSGRMKFLEKIELIRKIEVDLRTAAHVRGTVSFATFQPERTTPPDKASPRERVAFNRDSKALETQVRTGTSELTGALVALAPPADSSAGDQWRIRMAIDQAAEIPAVISDLNQRIQLRTRYEPGVDHRLAGVPILEVAGEKAMRRGLIVMSVAAFGLAALLSIVGTASPAGVLLLPVPPALAPVAVLGLLSMIGFPIGVPAIFVAYGMGLWGLQAAIRIVWAFRENARNGLDQERAAAVSASSLFRENVTALLTLTGPALLLGTSLPDWIVAVTRMATGIGVVSLGLLNVVLPALLAGRLGTAILNSHTQRADHPIAPEQDSGETQLLRRSA